MNLKQIALGVGASQQLVFTEEQLVEYTKQIGMQLAIAIRNDLESFPASDVVWRDAMDCAAKVVEKAAVGNPQGYKFPYGRAYQKKVWFQYTPGVTPAPAPFQNILFTTRTNPNPSAAPVRASSVHWEERGEDTIATFYVLENLDE
jgi:hypothetical protein